MRWAGHVARLGEERKFYKFLVGKPEGKGDLEGQGVGGKMGSGWILGRLSWWGADWIRLAQDRDHRRAVVSAVVNLRVFAPRSLLLSYDIILFSNSAYNIWSNLI
jgi:hypothetical protein